MQERIFGVETEYSVACRKKEVKEFVTELNKGVGAAHFLKKLLPLRGDLPDNLKELCFFASGSGDSSCCWLGSNGACFYFDMQNPEYATPECLGPREALLHNAAGDIIVEELRQEVLRRGFLSDTSLGSYDDVFIFKMNTSFRDDAVNRTVGCHENYLTRDEFTQYSYPGNRFNNFCDFMIPFFSSRQIFDGAGGIIDDRHGGWHYIISQRAVFTELPFSESMTGGNSPRGLFNFKKGVHEHQLSCARLHVACGDHNMSLIGKYIAMSATHLVLRAFEEGDFSKWKYRPDREPFKNDLLAITNDLALEAGVSLLQDGSNIKISALNIQKEYAEFVLQTVKSMNAEEQEMFNAWTGMVDKLAGNPEDASCELDWLIKLNFLREHCGASFGSSKARFASALYHDISERGIYHKLLRGGKAEPFAATFEIAACRVTPPNSRAEFRSRYIRTALKNHDSSCLIEGWGLFRGLNSQEVFSNPFEATSAEIEAFLEKIKR